MLSNDKKKKLRAIAHQEKPLVYIGKNGITETVLETFETSLMAHNLVKVSLQKTAPLTAKEAGEYFADYFSCDIVSTIGRVVILYRPSKNGRIIV